MKSENWIDEALENIDKVQPNKEILFGGLFDDYCLKCLKKNSTNNPNDVEENPNFYMWKRGRSMASAYNNAAYEYWICPLKYTTKSKTIPPEQCPYTLEIMVDVLIKDDCVKCAGSSWNNDCEEMWEQGYVYCSAKDHYIQISKKKPDNCKYK